MTYIYTIKTSPDPENPNEQAPGNDIHDDRLYGKIVATVSSANQTYTPESFTKNEYSNKLSSTVISFANLQQVVVTTV